MFNKPASCLLNRSSSFAETSCETKACYAISLTYIFIKLASEPGKVNIGSNLAATLSVTKFETILVKTLVTLCFVT